MMPTTKQNLNREFGSLLTQGLKSIAAREDKNISVLEDELATVMNRTFATLEKWRQGRIPPEAKQALEIFMARASKNSLSTDE